MIMGVGVGDDLILFWETVAEVRQVSRLTDASVKNNNVSMIKSSYK